MSVTTPGDLIQYCQKMSMSYSYKPVLIMALLNNNGRITSWEAANYFAAFYASRLELGLVAEKSNSIYSNLDCTLEQIRQNIVSNPVKALLNSSDFFEYDSKQDLFAIKPALKTQMTPSDVIAIKTVCVERLEHYFGNITTTASNRVTLFCEPNEENGYLSNNFEATFSIMGQQFTSVTQYMTYRKALICGQEARGRHILSIRDPAELNAVYDGLKCDVPLSWNGQKQVIAFQGIISKFLQNEELGRELLNTGSTVIGACFSSDPIWGIGLNRDDIRAISPETWEGQNLLGFTLMQVRNSICNTRCL